MQLKLNAARSVAYWLTRTWQHTTWLACATQAPIRPRRLIVGYVAP
jgi:hypothetical protein